MTPIIPVNAQYYVASTGKIISGDGINQFPEICKDMDQFVTPVYVYTFRAGGIGEGDCWAVMEVKNKRRRAYPPVLSEINGCKVAYMLETFAYCSKMVNPPAIPEGVISISGIFRHCTAMMKAPRIPKTVEYMNDAFLGCGSLTEAPEIPEGMKCMANAFSGCIRLQRVYKIPASVEDMTATFYSCVSLRGMLECDADPRKATYALRGTRITEIQGNCPKAKKNWLLGTK